MLFGAQFRQHWQPLHARACSARLRRSQHSSDVHASLLHLGLVIIVAVVVITPEILVRIVA
jgi:hypothetical protein